MLPLVPGQWTRVISAPAHQKMQTGRHHFSFSIQLLEMLSLLVSIVTGVILSQASIFGWGKKNHLRVFLKDEHVLLHPDRNTRVNPGCVIYISQAVTDLAAPKKSCLQTQLPLSKVAQLQRVLYSWGKRIISHTSRNNGDHLAGAPTPVLFAPELLLSLIGRNENNINSNSFPRVFCSR